MNVIESDLNNNESTSFKKQVENETQQTQTPLTDEMKQRNSLAKDTRRNSIFKEHRQQYKLMMSVLGPNNSSLNIVTLSEPAAKPQSKTNKMLNDLKPLYLSGLDFTRERFVKGFKLALTIMEYPIVGPASSATAFVVQDDMGYIERLVVYSFTDTQKKQIRDGKMFGVGSRIILIEPYVKIASDGKSAIRIDESNKIFDLNEIVNDMCRFCGKKDAQFKCAKCSKAKYCCKECQHDDWKILSHKFVCA